MIDGRARKRERLALVGVLVVVVLACGHALANELVWDDLYIIRDGNVIFDLGKLPQAFSERTMFISVNDASLPRAGAQTYRPLTVATFFLDAQLSGRSPLAYHATNLLAHLLCVFLVFLLARKLLSEERRNYALFAAAWFGLTPELAEAHVWINGRSDLFATLFVLAALLTWIRASTMTTRAAVAATQLGAGALFLCALLSKEPAIGVLPALLFFPHFDGRWRERLTRLWPFVVAVVVYLALRKHALGGAHVSDGGAQLNEALLRMPALVADAFIELLVPTRVHVRALSADYDALGETALLGIAVFVVAALAFAYYRARREFRDVFLLSWFLLTLAPAAFVTTTLWPGFGRYLYLPAVPLALLLADRLASLRESLRGEARATKMVTACVALYLSFLAVRLHLYVYDWRDETTLYQSWIASDPDRPHGYGWLGYTYLERGDTEHAIPLLAEAAHRSPNDPRFLLSLASSYLALGRVDEAVHELKVCIRETRHGLACNAMARSLSRDRAFNEAWRSAP